MLDVTTVFSRKRLVAAAIVLLSATAAQSAYASPITITNWTNITTNGADDVGSQLELVITDNLDGTVDFRFENNVGTASSITDIYFDDSVPLLFTNAYVLTESAGVDFGVGASPPDLPGGGLTFTKDHSFDSEAGPGGVSAHGINSAAEFLAITFTFAAGQTFADLFDRLVSGDFRVGLHVQSISPTGGSDSYINVAPDSPTVPEPAGLLLFGAGLAVAAARMRRFVAR
jgi:hypothetical protein